MDRRSLINASLAAAIFLSAATSAAVLGPAPREPRARPDLDAVLPDAFGDWTRVALTNLVLPAEGAPGEDEAVSYRAFRNRLGQIVTLVVAYGPPSGDHLRLHRPETCYVAQGFIVVSRKINLASFADASPAMVHLLAERQSQIEAVSYWLRHGDGFSTSGADAQFLNFRSVGKPRVDGALVRVSTQNGNEAHFEIHAAFLSAFIAALGPEGRALLLGAIE